MRRTLVTQTEASRKSSIRFHLLNGVLALAAALLGVQSLLARSVSAGWDLGLLLPLLLAAALLLWVAVRLIRRGRAVQNRLLRRVVLTLAGIGLAVFVLVQGLFVLEPYRYGAHQLEADGVETSDLFVIVLGCGIKPDGTPTWALANRLDAALAWYRAHAGTRLVVSGGQGAYEPTSEAASMAQYLLDKGVPAADILVEDRSTSTMENFQFSIPILWDAGWRGEPVLYATNDFHLFRGRMLAGRYDLEAYGLPAPTPPVIRPNVYLREFFAFFKSLLVDWPTYEVLPN
jgi:uncharacterized SAM-binding protein YcdF (DUF218 family)